jgi:hypothetical protein
LLKEEKIISHFQNRKSLKKKCEKSSVIENEWTKYFDNGKIDWTKKIVNRN